MSSDLVEINYNKSAISYHVQIRLERVDETRNTAYIISVAVSYCFYGTSWRVTDGQVVSTEGTLMAGLFICP